MEAKWRALALALEVSTSCFLFFAPLVIVMGAYCIVFVVHKVVPEKDDVAGRQMLFFGMVFITLGMLGYGVIFANEIFNNVPTEMCKQQITMGQKECVSWLTGIPGGSAAMADPIPLWMPFGRCRGQCQRGAAPPQSLVTPRWQHYTWQSSHHIPP